MNDIKYPIRVIHIVAPAFGHTFKGPTRRLLRLFNEWNIPGISLFVWGSSYFDKEVKDRKLWSKPIRQTRLVRLSWSIRLLWMLIRDHHRYDLIHVHNLWWGGLLAPVIARLMGKKAIYHMTLIGSDHPSSLVEQNLGKIKERLFRQYDSLIGISLALLADCQKYHYKSNLFLLPNPVALDCSQVEKSNQRLKARKYFGIPEDAKVLMIVGSIIYRKGVDLLIDTFIQLSKDQKDLYLLLVGAKDTIENTNIQEDFVQSLHMKLHLAGLDKQTIWTGLLHNEDDLIDTYLLSDIFVFPTRAEGQGNVILEAMACGLPVVCSYLPGVTDMMVIQGESGFLVDVDDLDGFISRIRELLNDSSLRRKMGNVGRQKAIAEFSFSAYCNNLANFYQELIDNNKYQ